MPITRTAEPLAGSDEELRAALEDAFLPALLPALAQALADPSLLREDLRPPGMVPGVLQGGMTEDQQAAAKEVAFEALRRLRDGGMATPARSIEDDIRDATAWMTGAPVTDEYIPFLIEELAPADDDPRAPTWRYDGSVPLSVVIIGAGMSGIVAAIRLKQIGIPFTVIEKNADVGGTWFENTYPGARVDVSNAFYSYSFAQKIDWPKYFSPQDVLLDYFRDCADEYGIRDSIRFRTEVLSATWDDSTCRWTLRLRTPDGGEEAIETSAIVSAVGQLNRPLMPDCEGLDDFKGPAFHSAQWNHEIELKGKRVAVIGNGASAAQFVPIIAADVAQLDVYQRTPNWFFPAPTYHDDVPEGLRWLFEHVPHYMHWYRFWLFWNTAEGLLPAATVDPAWPDKTTAVSEANDQLRALLTMYLQSQYADRPDLMAKVIPGYPPTAKRVLIDNGAWGATMKRENVELITEPIERITPDGVRTCDGTEREADVIIYATGFQASKFLMPMSVTGRNGADLQRDWDGDARAYMGITVPGFPNFFMCYGPNTNIVVNGSIIYFSECEVRYITGCLELLQKQKHRALDVRREVHDAYNKRIDEANKMRTWGCSDVSSWYKNSRGRVAQNWPFNLIEYWKQTLAPDPADYELL